MARIIRSPAFPGGYVSVTPFDDVEAYISDHANLFAWVSGAGLTLREIDMIWDDIAKPTLSYYSPGGSVAGAKPSADVNGKPSIRITDGISRLNGSLSLPSSLTIAVLFRLDDPATGGNQVLLSQDTTSWPHLVMSVN